MFSSSTKNEPLHYLLKIESFSILSEAGTIKIESDVFEAAGHKWRLELYPNGKDGEKSGNDISLYLIICDTGSLAKGWNVRVDVNFFVYDYICNRYVTFENVDGNRTRFHEGRIKWGFSELISLEHFKKSSSGYLYNDSCVFGAEVFQVPDYTLKDRCLSIIKPLETMNTGSWTVDNFSSIKDNYLYSEVLKLGKVKWTLLLYPKGNKVGAGTYLSIFLKVHEASLLPDGWRVFAKYELRVKNQLGHDDKVQEMDHWFCKLEDDWGFSKFLKLSEVRDVSKGFLLNDKLIIEAKISVVGMLKDFI